MAKIFISSTSADLHEHRQRVMTTLRRMEQNDIAMELFGAEPDTPVNVCKERVIGADLVVLILAYRYGWIPTQDEGGDGVSSMTRIEFETALQYDRPVIAFIVDEKSAWTAPAEQDRLLTASSEREALAVWTTVLALQRFKQDARTLVRDTFSTPADLADKVGTAVARWLLRSQQLKLHQESAQLQLQDLMEKVSEHEREGNPEIALTYLSNALVSVQQQNRATVADTKLRLAIRHLSPNDQLVREAAEDVQRYGGKRQATAALYLGKADSLLARRLWAAGEKTKAWEIAGEARKLFEKSVELDGNDPDTHGSLGGLLKRLAAWAVTIDPTQVQALEDATLDAYLRGSELAVHAYPLLNYIEQRAVLAHRRKPGTQTVLIHPDETELRTKLQKALKSREAQLMNRQDRPWAAFDLARGRHYLDPNVPGFLEDLENALEEARFKARLPEDRYMVTTVCDSLRSLLEAEVQLDGLREGIEFLDRAVRDENWLVRSCQPVNHVEQKLIKLHAAVVELAGQQLRLTAHQGARVTEFIQATELRWNREDEARFQRELVEWKRSLLPAEGKFLRALWKIFGSKALEAASGGVPIDWDEAVKLADELLKG